MYYILVFRSQTQTYAFSSLLSSYRISNVVIQTPRQAEVSCGLSVKIPVGELNRAKSILARRAFSSFVGIFMVSELGAGMNKVVRVS